MGITLNKLPKSGSRAQESESRSILLDEASNELIFAVVGHVGSGTSFVATQLENLLKENDIQFEVEILKARDTILEWFESHKGLPLELSKTPSLADVERLQDTGDEMRAEQKSSGKSDHAAIAVGLVQRIRAVRAKRIGVEVQAGQPVKPDGKPRAYILDSLRHPAEVKLLRHIYKEAFILLGVVCEEEKRIARITGKYRDGGRDAAVEFMQRDADAQEKHGQHVGDTFHLSDYFLDNTADRTKEEKPNPEWNVAENLSRLVKIVTHSELVRPTVAEAAMHHAYSAKMQSACLSRQVGAAVVDICGNVVATGTNEVPRAGGGVYGESFEIETDDARCAFFGRYCRNTQEQNKIIKDLLGAIKELREASPERQISLPKELRKTSIGQLLEFSRSVHAEMDALLSAARKGVSLVGSRLFVTTFPCHYCARHIVAAGVYEVQYIEPYPKSQALNLHEDAIAVEHSGWKPPSQKGGKVLFRPFSGVAPQLYRQAFMKDRELKDTHTGEMQLHSPDWGTPWHLARVSYVEIEAKLSQEGSCVEGVDAEA